MEILNIMEIFILWIGFSLLVGVVGKNRNIGFGMAFLWAVILSPIIGLVIALLSDEQKSPEEVAQVHKYKRFYELAKKAEYKGNVIQAIDYYMDCLYHLENDYRNLKQSQNEKRSILISKIKSRVDELKAKP